MNVAELFKKSSSATQRDDKRIIEMIKNMVVWKENCNVLEIGCGPGNVTHDLLLPILPQSTNTFIAIDKQPGTVQYAQKNYGKTSKITFKQMDIVKDTLSLNKYENYFDYIFSFYCLQVIQEQELALGNIYSILKPGGQFYFSLVGRCTFYDLLDYLSNTEMWGYYLTDYKKAISHYHSSDNPKEDIETILVKLGYKVLHLRTEPKEHIFSFEMIKEIIPSHVPFRIPESLQNRFYTDFWNLMKKFNYNSVNEKGEELYLAHYTMLIGHITKITRQL